MIRRAQELKIETVSVGGKTVNWFVFDYEGQEVGVGCRSALDRESVGWFALQISAMRSACWSSPAAGPSTSTQPARSSSGSTMDLQNTSRRGMW